MPETRSQTQAEIEPYKLSEIFSIIPEFEGDPISLPTFLDACDCAIRMASGDQRILLTIHIKNKLRGKAAQLINSRKPSSYTDIKNLLNLHFGDSRDLTSLIHDLQRLRQLSNESPLTFFNTLQVLNAKMQASIQKSDLTQDQKKAQCTLIDSMALNTLLTGLEPRLGQIIRASNPPDLIAASNRIRRELQLSYFETQKSNKDNQNNPKPSQPMRRTSSNFSKCTICGRIGHLSSECRSSRFPSYQNQYNGRPQNYQNNQNQYSSNQYNNRPQNYQGNPNQYSSNQQNLNPQRSTFPSQNQPQNRPTVIQRNPNFQNFQQRAHVFNEYPDDLVESYGDYYTENDLQPDYFYDYTKDTPNYTNDTSYYTNDTPDLENYQDFLSLPNQNHPPVHTNLSTDIMNVQQQIQALNLDNFDPNVNFPEQKFL